MEKTALLRTIIIVVLLATAVGRAIFWFPPDTPEQLSHYHSQTIEFTGVIIRPPARTTKSTQLIVKGREYRGRVKISVGLYPEYRYGDVVRVSCRLERPEPLDRFRYDLSLASQQIFSVCSFPKITVIDREQGNVIYGAIVDFGERAGAIVDRQLPSPTNELLKGMMLNQRSGIPAEINQQFATAGVNHVISISGLHVTIIAALLLQIGLAVGLSRRRIFPLMIIALVLFMILIGWPPPAVRATVMGTLDLAAKHWGRLSNGSAALLIAVLVMLAVNPLLIADIGFELSALAMWGIQRFAPVIAEWWERRRCPPWLAEIFSMTLAAQLTTTPLTLYYFGQVSLVAPLANMIIIPLTSIVMASGLAGMAAGFIHPFLAAPPLLVSYLSISVVDSVATLASRIPYAALTGIHWPMMATIGWLVSLVIIEHLWRRAARSLS